MTVTVPYLDRLTWWLMASLATVVLSLGRVALLARRLCRRQRAEAAARQQEIKAAAELIARALAARSARAEMEQTAQKIAEARRPRPPQVGELVELMSSMARFTVSAVYTGTRTLAAITTDKEGRPVSVSLPWECFERPQQRFFSWATLADAENDNSVHGRTLTVVRTPFPPPDFDLDPIRAARTAAAHGVTQG